MDMLEILLYPCDKMILECSFDELMEKIRGEHFVDVSPREMKGEWLNDHQNNMAVKTRMAMHLL